MVKLAGTFSRLGSITVLVIGDFILDSYTIGKARRISPEAPVPVVHVRNVEHRAGGAGNVILNLISMGAKVVAVGRVGDDPAATHLRQVFADEGLSSEALFVQEGYSTPVKNRIIADGQQIVRIDHEAIVPIPEMLEQQVIESLPALLADVQVVAISDYGKGFLSRTLLAMVIQEAKQRGISVIADPKGVDFEKYSGATILKPNLSEAYAAANMPLDGCLDLVAAKILQLSQVDALMITRSEAGLSIFHRDGTRDDFPVVIREVKDVTGAGDTVLAMLAYAIGNELSIAEAAQLSNLAAGVAIERFGCARVELSDVAERLLRFDSKNKVFDSEHLFALQHLLKRRRVALLSLSCRQELTSEFLKYLINLGERSDVDLLVYLRDGVPSEDLLMTLIALQAVDFIVLHGESLEELVEKIAPDECYALV